MFKLCNYKQGNGVVFGILSNYFIIYEAYLLLVNFSRTIRTCVCFFSVYESYLFFIFTCRNFLVKSPLGGC